MDVKEIVDQIDLLEYVSQYIEMKQDGREWYGISPFSAKDTDPSFSVTPSKNIFYDFSAGFGGNVINFIKKYHKVSGKEAVEMAAKYIGCEIEFKDDLPCVSVLRRFKVDKYCFEEPTPHVLIPQNVMDKFKWDEEKFQTWINDGITLESLKKFNVKYDPYSNRIVFPIYDNEGNIVSISGRTIDPEWKLKKLRKYTYFNNIFNTDLIYNFHLSSKLCEEMSQIVLFEGVKSVILAEQWGFHNVGALLTSHLNPYQLKILLQSNIKEVAFALDKNVNIMDDENVMRLIRYKKITWVKDFKDILGEKDAPCDKGYEEFADMHENREIIEK